MEFDIRTILLLLFLVSGLLALMLLLYWKTQKTYDGFSLWTWGIIILSFGYLLILLRNHSSLHFDRYCQSHDHT